MEAPLHREPQRRGSSLARLLRVQRKDEIELLGFTRAVAEVGVHIVCAAGPEAVASAALLGKALKRGRVRTAALTVITACERADAPTWREWLSDARALIVVGLGLRAPLVDGVPQLVIDAGNDDSGAHETLAERAFRLGEALAPLGDATWLAAVGLLARPLPHRLIERALARHTRADMSAVTELLDAAARGPQPAIDSLMAIEMLTAVAEPRRFLASVAAQQLARTRALVGAELARASRIRPRPGFGVVVVEYESPCQLEDLVAARWRGLRPGIAVLVANHGAVDGRVALTARAAVPEALERLRGALGDGDTALLHPDVWSQLRARLGVAPAAIERLGEPAEPTAPTMRN